MFSNVLINAAKCIACTGLDAKEKIHDNKIRAHSVTRGQTSHKVTVQFIDESFFMTTFLHVVDWLPQKLHSVKES